MSTRKTPHRWEGYSLDGVEPGPGEVKPRADRCKRCPIHSRWVAFRGGRGIQQWRRGGDAEWTLGVPPGCERTRP